MSVKEIDKRTVHQICSGQVVLSLAVAVKELVENSLDAGANNIEVRLREYGSELLEVVDNGTGVEPENFEALALKHHTSKIKEFSDLPSVATFGFRGEALSSLCALSDLMVTTCHSSQPVGTRIEFDSNGHVRSKVSCARERGTSVTLQNLFHTLPVRYREFQRNLKKEYTKMIQILQGYCLISTGVRISCYNQTGKGKKQLALSTSSNPTVKGNILNVFGPKQLHQLVEVSQCSPADITLEEGGGVTAEAVALFRLSGYVSRCNHGYGRSASDRQYFFFNNRPCDHQKLVKAVNEVYHAYNRHQFPFIVLNITTAREHVDVNLTPDKRKVLLHQEKALLLLVKCSLTKMYEPMQREYDTCKHQFAEGSSSAPEMLSGSSLSKLATLKRAYSCSSDPTQGDAVAKPPKQPKIFDYGVTVSRSSPAQPHTPPQSPEHRLPSNGTNSHNNASTDIEAQSISSSCEQREGLPRPTGSENRAENTRQRHGDSPCLAESCSGLKQEGEGSNVSPVTDSGPRAHGLEPPARDNTAEDREYTIQLFIGGSGGPTSSSASAGRQQTDNTSSAQDGTKPQPCEVGASPATAVSQPSGVGSDGGGRVEIDTKTHKDHHHKGRALTFDLEMTTRRLEALRKRGCGTREVPRDRGFKAKIRPDCNKAAEEELRREVSKEKLAKMEVIGQFNLGFIIGKIEDNLFIVDQHASDEKYNFERLQRTTTLQHQRLLQPKVLELTAVNEMVVTENLQIFRMNGFQFQVNPEGQPGRRIKLMSHPVSRNWTFDESDIEELIFLLSDSPGEVVRPSRIRQMFASRACRSSVMVGTALSKSEMRKLLVHMSELDQPWNCPHGRPTMRHLMDLGRT